MTDLTDVQRRELLRMAVHTEKTGGYWVPFVSRAHQALIDAGLMESVSQDADRRIRCTSEGLRVAERLRDEEAES